MGKGLDPKCRVMSLGPTDDDAIGGLVDHCTPVVFGNARPARALGAAAANKKRTETNEAKGKGKMTAADREVIRGENNVAVTGDGTEAPTATSETPFPSSDKYQFGIAVPVLDKTLKGKKTLYLLFGDQDDRGLQYKPFNVKDAKRPERAGANGVALEAPMFVF